MFIDQLIYNENEQEDILYQSMEEEQKIPVQTKSNQTDIHPQTNINKPAKPSKTSKPKKEQNEFKPKRKYNQRKKKQPNQSVNRLTQNLATKQKQIIFQQGDIFTNEKPKEYQQSIKPYLKGNTKMTPTQTRARKILQNYPQDLEKQTLTYFKRINYKGSSITAVVRPNKQPSYLSKRNFPLILNNFNSFLEVTDGKTVNTFDPTYSESTWKVLNKQRHTCNCTKSHCKKSYCQCFLNKRVCGDGCGCIDCKNTQPHQKVRQELFTLGCQCHKSQCITSYCRCRKLQINCGDHCKCTDDCKN